MNEIINEQAGPARVSVIVPVYKAEAYLERCVKSLQNQTLQNIEIILVDDGSPDACGQMCDAYAASDARVKVVHKVNGGLRSARIAGMEAATGDYVIHCDPDDWCEPDMLEELYSEAIKNHADIVLCNFFFHGTQGVCVSIQKPRECTASGVLRDLCAGKLHGSLCNKLVHRKLYWNEVFLPLDINMLEDVLTCVHLLQNSDLRISYVDKAFYHYDTTINNNSIAVSRAWALRRCQSVIRAVREMEQLIPPELIPELYVYKKPWLVQMLRNKQLQGLQAVYAEIRPRLLSELFPLSRVLRINLILLVGGSVSWRLASLLLTASDPLSSVLFRFRMWVQKRKKESNPEGAPAH